ncbi:MAG: hypothetical protein Tsb009_00400 [Planctomycetaceae bacterium]
MKTSLAFLLSLVMMLVVSGCGGIGEEEANRNRDGAKWVIQQGGSVQLTDLTSEFKSVDALPETPFTVARVNLNRTKVTDKDLEKLQDLKSLEVLGLHSTNVTDKGMDTIANLESLKELDLSNTRITDKGLEKLSRLKNLEKLFVSQTGVTAEGVESLQAKLSDCKIIHIP